MFQEDKRGEPSKRSKCSKRKKVTSDLENLEDIDADFSGSGTWEALAVLWPIEDRPEGIYRRKKWVDTQSLEMMMRLQDAFEKRQRDLNASGGTQRDTKPAVIHVKKGKDDHFEQLCESRFLFRMPLSAWDFWWKLVPVQRKERYCNIDLKSQGMEAQVARSAINR